MARRPAVSASRIVGRRFVFAGVRAPDVMFVGWHPEKGIRAHGEDGSRAWLPLADVERAIGCGALIESERGAPFVLGREDAAAIRHRARIGIMGRGKSMLRLVRGGRWEKI